MGGRPDLVAALLAEELLLLRRLENRQAPSLGMRAAPARAALGQHADPELGHARPPGHAGEPEPSVALTLLRADAYDAAVAPALRDYLGRASTPAPRETFDEWGKKRWGGAGLEQTAAFLSP